MHGGIKKESRRGRRHLVDLLDGWAVIAAGARGCATGTWETASTAGHAAWHTTSTAFSTVELLQNKLAYVQYV